jgi:hypothetical protein
MFKKITILSLFLCGLALFTNGCSLITTLPAESSRQALYVLTESGETVLERYAPLFLIEDNQENYNRIGTPTVSLDESGKHEVLIDTAQSTVYAMTQNFTTARGSYSNLIYRVHFPKTPFPNLTVGKNVGLLVYVTLNSDGEPVLLTTLHTCGCYLAMIPTAGLPDEAKPDDWPENEQVVYGVTLPAKLERKNESRKILIRLRSETHRVIDVGFASSSEYELINAIPMRLLPMEALNRLPTPNRGTTSFFETKGHRKGLVKDSGKPLELLFMSWWVIDPFIGVDKALGPPEETGVTMYTSLKLWARDKSNIWNFSRFLKYWGWDL